MPMHLLLRAKRPGWAFTPINISKSLSPFDAQPPKMSCPWKAHNTFNSRCIFTEFVVTVTMIFFLRGVFPLCLTCDLSELFTIFTLKSEAHETFQATFSPSVFCSVVLQANSHWRSKANERGEGPPTIERFLKIRV